MIFTRFYPGLTIDDIDHMTLLQVVKFSYGVMAQIEDEMLLNSPNMGGEKAQRQWSEITETRREQIWNMMYPATKNRAKIQEKLASQKREQAKEFVEMMNEE